MIATALAFVGRPVGRFAVAALIIAALAGWHWWQVIKADRAGYARAAIECAQERDRHNAVVEAERTRLTRQAEEAARALADQDARSRTAMEELEAHARTLETRPARPAVCPVGGGLSPDSVRRLRAIGTD